MDIALNLSKYYDLVNRKEYILSEWVIAFLLLPIFGLIGFSKIGILLFGLIYTASIFPVIPEKLPISKSDIYYMFKKGIVPLLFIIALLISVNYNWFCIVIRQDIAGFLLTIPLYPILSVIPQEFIYRRFYFERYKNLMPKTMLLFSNVIVFSYSHIACGNIYAIALTILGGVIFTETYARTNNFWLVCIEHAIYGLITFGLGWGYHFS